jgi:uncharacterized membrane protein
MKRSAILLPLVVFFLLGGAFVADVLLTTPQLPARLATHFGVDGKPDGWMTREEHVRFLLTLGLGSALFLLLVSEIITRLGGWGLNIPRRDYWLAPERRDQTLTTVQAKLIWGACLFILFFVGINHIILRANAGASAQLPGGELIWLVATFLGATIVWTVLLIRPFYRTS